MSRQLTALAAKLSAHVIYFRRVPAGLIFSNHQRTCALKLTRMGSRQAQYHSIGYRLLVMEIAALPPSLHCHALGQIARFIHVATKMYGQVVSK
jgi:hypothetical protein